MLGLLKNSGVYIQKTVERIEKSIATAMEGEAYAPITLNDVLDYEKYVDKYMFQIEGISHEYPIYLPFTMLVVQTNEDIKGVRYITRIYRELWIYSIICGLYARMIRISSSCSMRLIL